MSKIDCSNIVNFIKEINRLTNNCCIDCSECPLSDENNEQGLSCNIFVKNCPEQAVLIVQKWSDENPVKTRLDDFTEKYPNYFKDPIDDIPNVCCKYLGYIDKCPLTKCSKCWNMPL